MVNSQMVVVYVFNPSTLEAEAGDLCEVGTSLIYRASSRSGWLYRETVLKNKNNKKIVNKYYTS